MDAAAWDLILAWMRNGLLFSILMALLAGLVRFIRLETTVKDVKDSNHADHGEIREDLKVITAEQKGTGERLAAVETSVKHMCGHEGRRR